MTWAELFSELTGGLQAAFETHDDRTARLLNTQLGNLLAAHGAAQFPDPTTTVVPDRTAATIRKSSVLLSFS